MHHILLVYCAAVVPIECDWLCTDDEEVLRRKPKEGIRRKKITRGAIGAS